MFTKLLRSSSPVRPVTAEMNLHAAPAQLAIEVVKGQQVIGPEQDMHRAGQVRNRLNYVQLVQELPSRCQLNQMLSLIDQDRQGAPVA